MAAGTKIFLAIAALFIGGVVLYYGVLTPPVWIFLPCCKEKNENKHEKTRRQKDKWKESTRKEGEHRRTLLVQLVYNSTIH